MTSRDRVLKALEHKEADRIPIDLGTTNSTGISVKAYNKLLKYLGKDGREAKVANVMQQLALVDEDILDRFCIDTRGLSPNSIKDLNIVEEHDSLHYTDEWGIKWKMPKNGHYFDMVGHPLKNVESVKEVEEYEWAEPGDPKRIKGLKEKAHYLKNTLNKAVLLRGIVPGTLEFSAWLRGYEQLFLDFYLNPEIAHAILEKAMEIKISYWDTALTELGGSVDVINESDDLGSQTGPLISLSMYQEFIKPRHRKLVESIKRKTNAKVFLHSCGSVYQFIPELIEVGFDILNPLQVTAEGMDAVKLKREFGKDISFWGGGIDTQEILPRGTPVQIKDEVKRRIDQLSKGGGFVFSQIHNIQSDVPPENIIAMYEAFMENCNY